MVPSRRDVMCVVCVLCAEIALEIAERRRCGRPVCNRGISPTQFFFVATTNFTSCVLELFTRWIRRFRSYPNPRSRRRRPGKAFEFEFDQTYRASRELRVSQSAAAAFVRSRSLRGASDFDSDEQTPRLRRSAAATFVRQNTPSASGLRRRTNGWSTSACRWVSSRLDSSTPRPTSTARRREGGRWLARVQAVGNGEDAQGAPHAWVSVRPMRHLKNVLVMNAKK